MQTIKRVCMIKEDRDGGRWSAMTKGSSWNGKLLYLYIFQHLRVPGSNLFVVYVKIRYISSTTRCGNPAALPRFFERPTFNTETLRARSILTNHSLQVFGKIQSGFRATAYVTTLRYRIHKRGGPVSAAPGFNPRKLETLWQCDTEVDQQHLQKWLRLSALHGNWSTARTLMTTWRHSVSKKTPVVELPWFFFKIFYIY